MEGYKSHRKERQKEFNDKLEDNMVKLCASIVKEAQQNANKSPPGHPQVQTGTLRRSITLDVKQVGKVIEGRVGIMKGKGEGDKALIYAPFVEFGTIHHPPYPFLFPAVEAHKGRIKEFFKK